MKRKLVKHENQYLHIPKEYVWYILAFVWGVLSIILFLKFLDVSGSFKITTFNFEFVSLLFVSSTSILFIFVVLGVLISFTGED